LNIEHYDFNLLNKLKMKPLLLTKRRSVYFLSILAIMSFIYLSCEKNIDSQGDNFEYLDITGDLNNPETYDYGTNRGIFNKASFRIGEHLSIENNMLSWDINSGSEINISESLFSHITANFQKINEQVANKKLLVSVDKSGKITIQRKNSKNLFSRIISSLKSSSPETPASEPKDLNSMSSQEVLEYLMDIIDQFNNGTLNASSLADIVKLGGTGWTYDGAGGTYMQGTGTVDGVSYQWTVSNACAYNSTGSYCDFNNLTTGDYEQFGNDNYDMIRNPCGNPLISIHY
jgi:hypothetical protein